MWHSGYILHRYRYGESSLLVKLWLRDLGLVPAVVKGVRRAKSRLAGISQPFTPLQVQLAGKGEVQTVRQMDVQSQPVNLLGNALAVGFYLNELLLAFVPQHEPMPELFDGYSLALQAQHQGVNQAALRQFELQLLQLLGYEVVAGFDDQGLAIVADSYYHLQPGQLPFKVTKEYQGSILGQLLLNISCGDLQDAETLLCAKRLCRAWIDHYSCGRTFASRQLLRK